MEIRHSLGLEGKRKLYYKKVACDSLLHVWGSPVWMVVPQLDRGD